MSLDRLVYLWIHFQQNSINNAKYVQFYIHMLAEKWLVLLELPTNIKGEYFLVLLAVSMCWHMRTLPLEWEGYKFRCFERSSKLWLIICGKFKEGNKVPIALGNAMNTFRSFRSRSKEHYDGLWFSCLGHSITQPVRCCWELHLHQPVWMDSITKSVNIFDPYQNSYLRTVKALFIYLMQMGQCQLDQNFVAF